MEVIFDNNILSSQKLECFLYNNNYASFYQILGEEEKDSETYDEQNDKVLEKMILFHIKQ